MTGLTNVAILTIKRVHRAARLRSDVQTRPHFPNDLIEKLCAQNVAFEELIIPDEIHDLLRWSDWIRAYRAPAEFFDRKLAPAGNRL